MNNCIFCKIINSEIPTEFVYEDEYAVVFKDIHPKAPVHLLIVPKKHIQSLAFASEFDSELLIHLLFLLNKIAKIEGLSGFRTVINTGKEGGQEIDHLHFHLLAGHRLPGL